MPPLCSYHRALILSLPLRRRFSWLFPFIDISFIDDSQDISLWNAKWSWIVYGRRGNLCWFHKIFTLPYASRPALRRPCYWSLRFGWPRRGRYCTSLYFTLRDINNFQEDYLILRQPFANIFASLYTMYSSFQARLQCFDIIISRASWLYICHKMMISAFCAFASWYHVWVFKKSPYYSPCHHTFLSYFIDYYLATIFRHAEPLWRFAWFFTALRRALQRGFCCRFGEVQAVYRF